jgi:hypothetical protein
MKIHLTPLYVNAALCTAAPSLWAATPDYFEDHTLTNRAEFHVGFVNPTNSTYAPIQSLRMGYEAKPAAGDEVAYGLGSFDLLHESGATWEWRWIKPSTNAPMVAMDLTPDGVVSLHGLVSSPVLDRSVVIDPAGTIKFATYYSTTAPASIVTLSTSGSDLNLNGSKLINETYGDGRYLGHAQGTLVYGYGSTATGAYAVAMGHLTAANGDAAVAMGESTGATGIGSTALGSGSRANGLGALALGFNALATGEGAVALGTGHATGRGSYALGLNSAADGGEGATAFGAYALAHGQGSVAAGWSNQALGWCSFAMGYQSISNSNLTFAMGGAVHATGSYSAAFGNCTASNGPCQFVVGKFNVLPYYNQEENIPSIPLFIVGNGTSDTARSNAFVVTWDGHATAQGDVNATGKVTAGSGPTGGITVSGTFKAVYGKVLVPLSGDISMGDFATGEQP